MTASITTRAGRKIRHVAPGHVVDVATGIEIASSYTAATSTTWWVMSFPGFTGRGFSRLTDALVVISVQHPRASAVCALVRGMLALGGCS